MRSLLESLFDIPLVIAGLVIVGSLCLLAIGGLLARNNFRLARVGPVIHDLFAS